MKALLLSTGAVLGSVSLASAQVVAEPLLDAGTVTPIATAVTAILGVMITVAVAFAAFRYARSALK